MEAAVVVFKAIGDTFGKVVVIVVVESVCVVGVLFVVVVIVFEASVISAVVDSNKFTLKYLNDESLVLSLSIQTNRIEFGLMRDNWSDDFEEGK